MISGNTLPNEDNPGTNDGTIVFGTNSSGITVTIGSITSYEATTATTTGEAEISHSLEEADEPTGWFVTGTFGGVLTPELKESIAGAAANMEMPEQSLWLIIWFGVSVAISLSVLLFTGSTLTSLTVAVACLWAGTNAGIVDFGLVFLVVIIGFGTFYLVRQ